MSVENNSESFLESGALDSAEVARAELPFTRDLSILKKIEAKRALASVGIAANGSSCGWCQAPWELSEIAS